MRKFKTNLFSEKLLFFLSKLALFFVCFIICLWMISGAKAAEQRIDKIDVIHSSPEKSIVEIVFNSPIQEDKITASFDRDFIQFSLQDVSAYPSKLEKVAGGKVRKIYSYQYKPNISRTRIFFDEKAEKIKKYVHWVIDGNKIKIEIKSEDLLKTVKSSILEEEFTAEEELLFSSLSKKNDLSPTKENEGNKNIYSKNMEMIYALLFVVFCIGAVSFLLRKIMKNKGLKVAKRKVMINVLGSHTLSQGKEISVIKVGEQYMVIGVTNHNINLIKSIEADFNENDSFDSVFKEVSAKDKNEEVIQDMSVISSIKRKIRGFKQLN